MHETRLCVYSGNYEEFAVRRLDASVEDLTGARVKNSFILDNIGINICKILTYPQRNSPWEGVKGWAELLDWMQK